MLLVMHIIVAIAGLLQAALAVALPSTRKVQALAGLLALTLTSGALLVLQWHAPLASACMSGVVYTAIVLAADFVARRRLALRSQV
jgi:hypothetical protein